MSKFQGNAITWFEIPTLNVHRATEFYESLLATKLRSYPGPEPYSLFPIEGGGVGGCIVQRSYHKPTTHGTLVYINVDGTLGETLERAQKLKSRILVPRTEIPGGYGFYACITDSEGNHIGLHSHGA